MSREGLSKWTADAQRAIKANVLRAMATEGPKIAARARAQAGAVLKGKKAAASIRSKIWNQRPGLPALQISSKIPWLGVHERGATISGRMLIQIGERRLQRKVFARLVDTLRQQKLAFFKRAGDGKVYLMAKSAKGVRGLASARRAERGRRVAAGGTGRIGRDEAVPIAILVTQVTVKKRLRIKEVIEAALPALASASEG